MAGLAACALGVRACAFWFPPPLTLARLPDERPDDRLWEPQTVLLEADVYSPEEERWYDIAGNPYATSFRERFRYADARVQFTYLPVGPSFRGQLVAEGLKPNFAYQLKLRGDYARDPDVHRVIGYLGRWRLLDEEGFNFSDRDYRALEDKSRAESYILFDFFVTDETGRAEKTFYLNSSLHVLWNSALNYVWTHRDLLSQAVTVMPDSPAYGRERSRKRQVVELWAESQRSWARSRPSVGELELPVGRYRCDVVLTEESFHQGLKPRGGEWATVLRGPVEFVVWR